MYITPKKTQESPPKTRVSLIALVPIIALNTYKGLVPMSPYII